ncbi:MAG TPA: UBact family ubiquitin protein [Armatimonadaceae bacterium]|nr:UBact family ubiquitin protein [Armatimonadaceae bacterium]
MDKAPGTGTNAPPPAEPPPPAARVARREGSGAPPPVAGPNPVVLERMRRVDPTLVQRYHQKNGQ